MQKTSHLTDHFGAPSVRQRKTAVRESWTMADTSIYRRGT
jgi:hypothetical protein